MTDWGGECCSFADVDDGTDIRCQLTIVGSCRWWDPRMAPPPGATFSVYAGTVFHVDEEAECPPSWYSVLHQAPSQSPSAAHCERQGPYLPTSSVL